MGSYQQEKKLVLSYFEALEKAGPAEVDAVLDAYHSADYDWKASHPFRELSGSAQVATEFWAPLKTSLQHMQRRQDIFIAGVNKYGGEVWVMSMGHFMGLFDHDWLGIPHTRKMASLHYAEFNCVQEGKITKTGLFFDLLGLMDQAGVYPLPPMTGASFVYPGPRGHHGLLFEDAPEEEGAATLAVVDRMCRRIEEMNHMAGIPPANYLTADWDDDMIWYGPCGIGATYTIPRYGEQHQIPFRTGLGERNFNGHVCRFAEGNFACFFGWPNLTNVPIGGFLGMPGAGKPVHMQVVDVYCRNADKLSENWCFIDIPWWLAQQGVDVLKRTHTICNPE